MVLIWSIVKKMVQKLLTGTCSHQSSTVLHSLPNIYSNHRVSEKWLPFKFAVALKITYFSPTLYRILLHTFDLQISCPRPGYNQGLYKLEFNISHYLTQQIQTHRGVSSFVSMNKKICKAKSQYHGKMLYIYTHTHMFIGAIWCLYTGSFLYSFLDSTWLGRTTNFI